MRKLTILTAVILSHSVVVGAQEVAPLGGGTGMNTTYGPTGLINVPSAFSARDGEARVGGSWGKDLSGPSVNYGILRYIEIGGAHILRRASNDKTIATGKVTLIPSNFNWLTVGIGIIDPFDAIDQSAYIIGTVDLLRPDVTSPTDARAIALRGHVGAGTGLYRERLIGGGELVFADRISVVAEYDARNFNAALRYKSTNDIQVQVGFRDKGLFFAMTSSIRF